jgi:hypothetical protein
MIVMEVLKRVFRVQYAGKLGTAFTIDHDGRQYLVSAKHIFDGASGTFEIDVFHENNWKPLQVALTGHSTSGDISVMAPQQLLTLPALKAEPSHEGLVYGQDVYFLGFPYGLFGDLKELNNGYPLPFAKKATLSMINVTKNSVMYLDGINNSGFSGGPVAFAVAGNQKLWRIAGVISSYLTAPEVISHQNEDVGLRYAANTGLIKATPINLAVDLVEANPNGFTL